MKLLTFDEFKKLVTDNSQLENQPITELTSTDNSQLIIEKSTTISIRSAFFSARNKAWFVCIIFKVAGNVICLETKNNLKDQLLLQVLREMYSDCACVIQICGALSHNLCC